MRILFIHGRSQGGKNPDQLKQIWVDTLRKGFQANGKLLPSGVAIDFPFYGDKLDELTAKAELDKPDGLTAKGTGTDKQYQEFLRSALDEIKQRKGISDDDVATKFEGSDIKEKGIQNWAWVQAIASYLDYNYIGFSDFTIEKFLTDVFLYVNSPYVTKSINKIIENELTDEPTVIVSHSLGTVVVYKVMLDNISAINLHKFITIGSPLGLSAISSKLGSLENPSANSNWFNAYDERDVVALNPLNSTYFPTDPEINNYNNVDNHTDNRHGIIGYLNNSTIANEIASSLANEV